MDIPSNFHFRHRRMVEFSDTDLAGIMHFANFLRFVESAEHAFFRSIGFRVHTSHGPEHEGWARLEVACKYLKPARFEETLEVGLRIDEVRTSGLRYSFWVFRVGDGAPVPVATGTCSIVHVELDTRAQGIRKAPIPSELRERLVMVTGASASQS